MKSYAEAEELFLEAYQNAKKANNKLILYSCVSELIEVHLKKKNISKVKELLIELEDLATNIHQPLFYSLLHEMSSRYHRLRGDQVSELAHLKSHYHLQDSLSNPEVRTQLANLEKRYDTKEKELTIVELNQQNELERQKVAQAEFRQNMFLLIVVLLLLLLLGGIWSLRKISRQRQSLADLNNVKDKLFSIISHDLRGMILPFSRAGKIIRHHVQKGDFDRTVTLADELEKNSVRLSHTLDNLLQWSAQQMQGLDNSAKDFLIKPLLSEVLKDFKQHADQKSLEMVLSCPETLNIKIDENAFLVIFRNLVSNAIKFTKKGKIEVSCEENSSALQFMVKDTGVGMTGEQLQYLFNDDKIETARGTDGESGTGLGLNLVKSFVETNGGSISVDSQVGSGTTFLLSFVS